MPHYALLAKFYNLTAFGTRTKQLHTFLSHNTGVPWPQTSPCEASDQWLRICHGRSLLPHGNPAGE